jgi:hypothetical protein
METTKVPTLVNPKNFKKTPIIEKPQGIKKLNLYLLIGFIVFLIFFLWNCKYGFLKAPEDSPEAFSIVYNLGSV